jgi:hypothetical protein
MAAPLDGCLGSFKVPVELLDNAPEILFALQARVLIFRAECHYADRAVHFDGKSLLFADCGPAACLFYNVDAHVANGALLWTATAADPHAFSCTNAAALFAAQSRAKRNL